jgi:hypothetical protein
MVGGIGLLVFIIITLTYICGLDGFMHVRIQASVAQPIRMFMVLSQLPSIPSILALGR